MFLQNLKQIRIRASSSEKPREKSQKRKRKKKKEKFIHHTFWTGIEMGSSREPT